MKRRSPLRNAAELSAAVLFEWVIQCFTLPAALAGMRRAGVRLFNWTRYGERARAQIAQAFPGWGEEKVSATADGCFGSLAESLVEVLRLSRSLGDPGVYRARVAHEIHPEAAAALRSGKGAIIVTAHLGSWELAPWCVHHLGTPLASVARPLENPLLDERFERLRRRLRQAVVPKEGALLHLVRHLRRGRSVALVVDQDARAEGIFVPFFGRPASTYDGMAALALRLDLPVVPGVLAREGKGRFRLVIERPLSREGLPAERSAAQRELTARMNAAIEAFVRRFPDQWIWHYRRWKTQPEGASSVERGA